MKVLCFVPMKNCQTRIGPLLSKFQGEILEYLSEILVVDNASTDSSVEEAKAALSQVTGVKVALLQNSKNYGLGGSHKIAFKYAMENQYDYILVVHGDNTVDPYVFLDVLKKDYFSSDMIMGDRLSRENAGKDYPLPRLLFNRILSRIVSLVTCSSVADFTGGPVNLYRVSSFLNSFENSLKGFSNQIEFSQYALLYGIYRRMKIRFVEIEFTEYEGKPAGKLITQFLKPLLLLVKFKVFPRRTIARDLRGSYFGHTFLKVKIDPTALILPPSPKPRVTDPEVVRLMNLNKTQETVQEFQTELPDLSGIEVACIRMKLLPWHLSDNKLEEMMTELLKTIPASKIILDISGDEVVKNKQCYDFLTFCLDRGIEPQLVTNAVGDVNLWRNYAKLVKNLTINYIPGEVQRSFFAELCKEVGPMGNVSVNVMTHPEFFYHSLGLKKMIEAEGSCRSVHLQPYFLEAGQSLPDDHMNVLLDQNAVVSTWFKDNVVRKHNVYPLGQTLKDKNRYSTGLKYGFMEISPKKIPKDKVRVFELEEIQGKGRLLNVLT
ncbi:MAG: glycosyltransferase family 2 protein [Bdellovibrionota bacterium]